MRQVKFTVPGEPVAKGRQRHRAIHTGHMYQNRATGRTEERIISQSYTPAQTASFENLVRLAFVTTSRETAWAGPVAVEIHAYLQVPKSARAWERAAAAAESLPHVKKPDADNIAKSVLDGLNTVAYVDDNLIFSSSISKRYSNRPRTEVILTFYTPEEAACQLSKPTSVSSSESCGSPTTQMTQPELNLSIH